MLMRKLSTVSSACVQHLAVLKSVPYPCFSYYSIITGGQGLSYYTDKQLLLIGPLLCAKHCSKCCMCLTYLFSEQPQVVRTIINPILEIRKLRHGEVKKFALNLIKQSWDQNLADARATTIVPYCLPLITHQQLE